jgi:hypothetical protein
MIGEDTLLRFGGVALGEACTIVIRGATQQIIDEAERSLHDAVCVLAATVRETRIVYGGGKVLIMFIYCGTIRCSSPTSVPSPPTILHLECGDNSVISSYDYLLHILLLDKLKIIFFPVEVIISY